MSTTPLTSAGEFEFNDSQNELIGSLARKMALVGVVMIVFGLLQMINGASTLFMMRDPERVIAAAQKVGMPETQLDTLRHALSGGFWSSPLTISAIAFAVAGLLLLVVGLWTRQAAGGFARIVLTQGADVARLMDALGSLNLKYGMMYFMILIAAIVSLLSFAMSLWHASRGSA